MTKSLREKDYILASRRGTASISKKDYSSTAEYWLNNAYELVCLVDAEEGNPSALAEYLREFGYLATKEARDYVRSSLLGLPKRDGRKRTTRMQAMDILEYAKIREIQKTHQCTEYAAKKRYLDENPDIKPETLKTQISRAKKTLKYYFGREPYSPIDG